MPRGKLIFITGGARSGKSSFAEQIALNSNQDVAYIATAQPLDEEMKERIERHKKRRPGNWELFEESKEVSQLISYLGFKKGVIIIECLTLLISNLLLLKNQEELPSSKLEEDILVMTKKMAEIAYQVPAQVIIVSNEVGMGLVPENKLGRIFRDILGQVNRIIADKADEVFFLVSGLPLKIKG